MRENPITHPDITKNHTHYTTCGYALRCTRIHTTVQGKQPDVAVDKTLLVPIWIVLGQACLRCEEKNVVEYF